MGRIFQWPISLRLLAVALGFLPAAAGQETAPALPGLPPGLDFPEFSRWEKILTLQSGLGFKDNTALAPVNPSGSGFFRNYAEFTLWRLPVDDWEFMSIASWDDLRYWNSPVTDKELMGFALAQGKRKFAGGWLVSATAQYIYQNQVMDVSADLATPAVLAVQGSTYTARIGLRHDLASRSWFELEPGVTRQDFAGPLDDYWEGGAKLTLGRAYAKKSELAFTYEFNQRAYDSREQADNAGFTLPGSSLEFLQHKTQLVWRHDWDARRRWRTTARAGYDISSDNGGGYFDYRKLYANGQIRYRNDKWEVRASGRISDFIYPQQTVSATDPRQRHRTDVTANLRVERTLNKHLKLYAEYEFEQSLSNQATTAYAVNQVHSGILVEY
ncbi:MAG: hypothetical protein HZA89_01760 [Verrucomicrobia bacterium]|nr:hypothetical protein [Verrucomicrobiota bacterium]